MIDNIPSGGSSFSLRAGLATLLLAYWIYAYIQKRREYEVQYIGQLIRACECAF